MENSNLRIIDASTIKEMLVNHEKALNGDEDGEFAIFYNADLRGADLRYTNLRDADLRAANLEGANLLGADLTEADLIGANLAGANLDFSSFPLWCGSLKANFDDKQIIQLIYHAVKAGLYSCNTSDEVKNELEKVIDLANKFHRVAECGRIERSKS